MSVNLPHHTPAKPNIPRAVIDAMRVQLRQIDRQIDGVGHELCRRTRVSIFNVGSWDRAWRQHPDLSDRNAALFQQRAAIQDQIVALTAANAKRSGRAQRVA